MKCVILAGGKGTRIEKEDMSPRDIELYNFGFNYETDRKDWG